jgi:UDP-N-acetylglucosamine diphosphorylase/glucosamine-1-phosphate N-acetyltransferase
MNLAIVILAAGKGTRMQSDLAKVLHPLAGKPLIHWVLEAAQQVEPTRTVVIVGHQAQRVEAVVREQFSNVDFALQSEMLGTGHAVQQAAPLLQDFDGDILITCGDVPLLRGETMQKLVAERRKDDAAASMLIGVVDEPGSYGRVLCEDDGRVHQIIEAKDASPEVLALNRVNAGTYCFKSSALWSQLNNITSNNASNEYYLTDVVGLLTRAGKKVNGVFIEELEMTGVNTRAQLDELEAVLQERA